MSNNYLEGETYQDDDGDHWKVVEDGLLRMVLPDGRLSTFPDDIEEVEASYGPLKLYASITPDLPDEPLADWEKELLAEKDDPVNHPSHYTSHPSGVECIQITTHENFNRGNALKYWWRAGSKPYQGKTLKESALIDYEKAIFYIQMEVKRLEASSGGQ